MNFFEHQQQARRSSAVLVFLFITAVLAIVVAVDAATLFAMALVETTQETRFDPNLVLLTATLVTLTVIGLGTLWKVVRLSSGGGLAVAEMMGATPVRPVTEDIDEKRLLNIVEEMAIASGSNVPSVFVMEDELSINAFAAGYAPSEASIVVSKGALTKLTREELQGVIAHEFSHIFNGDMRTNIRMLGVLNGILVIGLIGIGILRNFAGVRDRGYRRDSKGGGGGIIFPLMIFAIAMTIIGYIGVFFGRLIKASLSRSREYLADASAVQFTRNPYGIAGALKKIHKRGGETLGARNAEELSHFYFSDGVGFFLPFFATHPKIEARLTRILPGWETVLPDHTPPPQPTAEEVFKKLETQKATAVTARGLGDSIGAPGVAALAQSSDLLRAIPSSIKGLTVTPPGAEQVLFALLLAEHAELPEKLLENVLREGQSLSMLRHAHQTVRALPQPAWLAMASLCAPVLQALNPQSREQTVERLRRIAETDGHLSAHETALLALTEQGLSKAKDKRTIHSRVRLRDLRQEMISICAILARVGTPNEKEASLAFERGMLHSGISGISYGEVPKAAVNVALLPHLLKPITQAPPKVKEQALAALTEVAVCDNRISPEEASLLRTVAAALECPMPLLPQS